MKTYFSKTIFVFLISITTLLAQTPSIERVNPTNWYVGMKNTKLQLLIHGTNFQGCEVDLNYNGVVLKAVKVLENTNYMVLDLEIDTVTKPGKFDIKVSKNITTPQKKGKNQLPTNFTVTLPYELKARTAKPKSINSSDFIYLVLPDRFANGDVKNDKFKNMADTASDRKNPFLRHGGDLQGITNNLDYIKELGVTALWLNPVTENDQPQTNEGGQMRSAFHGYGFTDQYNVDRRFGGNEAYLKMIEAAHTKGLKVIQDVVYNHVGINHWFLKDMPMKSWLNQWDTYTNTSYRDEPVYDPYASESDRNEMLRGWFVPFLPDLNQKNEYVSNFLIQNALWTVEYFGIDGWRVDTYQYNEPEFMLKCNQALYDEYPNMFITGENSVSNTIPQAYYSKSNFNLAYKGNQTSANDFVLEGAILAALNEKFDWGKGLNRVYTVLSQDIAYQDPMRNLTFVDNHDHDRFFSVIGEDFNKYKMGIALLLTTRGIPSLYYGTENLTKNFKNPSDAEVRKDFEGGFPGDKINKFLASGRTEKENEAFNFVKTLANYRSKTPALHSGKLLQYLPKDGIYVYFRKNLDKTIMIILNQNTENKTIDTKRYAEGIGSYSKGYEVISGTNFETLSSLNIPAMGVQVIELR